jgi:hypothetical protein
MPINTETLNRQLYKRLSKYKPKPLDAKGNVTPVEDEADVFKFTFSKDGEDYGTVFATIDDNHALTIYYSDDVTESPSGSTPDIGYDDSWTGLLKQLKSWAMHNQLSWQLKDRSHLEGDMARREHMNKKDKISEGYYAMGKSRSYSDNIPSVKIVIEHSRQIEEGEQRYRNINKIFLENQMGERFLLDTKKPGIARVYARHIAEGGKVNDERWNHIQGLCEEYQKMAGFVRATRNGQFNESAQKLVNEAINHYQGLRESLSRMTGKRGYEAYFESWTPTLMEDEVEETNLNELFVQETLDPRIESVMPILSKLQKNLGEMKEVSALAEWADSLIEGEAGPEASEEPVNAYMGNDTFGDEDGEDAPEDDLSEEESLTSNNPIGIPEGEDHNPVAGAITRRILMQRQDLLKKFGPVKVMQAIDDVADFVGDTEEIGSSDVSGWIKQVEQSLGGNDLEEALDPEKKERLNSLIDAYTDATDPEYMGDDDHEDIIAQIRAEFGDRTADSIANGPSMHFPRPGHSMGHDDLEFKQMRKNMSPNRITKTGKLHKQDSDAMKRDIKNKFEVEEGIIDTIKSVGGKVLDKLGHGSDEDLLKDLQKKAGIPSHAQHGKPNMAKPNEKEVDESALQASFGIKKYGEDGMRELQRLGREHASKEKVAKAKAEYTSEDLDANQKRVGQLGPTSKVKNNNIGKLVGANENFINTVDQAVVSEMDKSQTPPGRDDDVKGPEGKATPITPKKMADDAKKVLDKQKVKEGQEDLDVIKRLLGK